MSSIETEFTPNPHSLKFNVNQVLLEKGTLFFTELSQAAASPLVQKLLKVPFVREVLIGHDFVTVSRDPATETWALVIPSVSQILEEHLKSGKPVVEGPAAEGPAGGQSDVEVRIRQVLDEKVRPAVAKDGGDITFHGFKDGVVTLHLRGACSTCPSSMATLKAGVERILCEAVPEVREVVQL